MKTKISLMDRVRSLARKVADTEQFDREFVSMLTSLQHPVCSLLIHRGTVCETFVEQPIPTKSRIASLYVLAQSAYGQLPGRAVVGESIVWIPHRVGELPDLYFINGSFACAVESDASVSVLYDKLSKPTRRSRVENTGISSHYWDGYYTRDICRRV